MPPRTQADMFIKTLKELRDQDLERKRLAMRAQVREHVKQFVREFKTDLGTGQDRLKWTPRRMPPVRKNTPSQQANPMSGIE